MVPWEHVSDLCSICIDEKDNTECCGRMYHWRTAEPFRFRNTDQVILQIDQIYKEPEASRIWSTVPGCSNQASGPHVAAIRKKRGKEFTFWLTVLQKQYNSWQGIVWWKEQQKQATFNSVTDLLLLFALASENAHMTCPTKEGSEPYEE